MREPRTRHEVLTDLAGHITNLIDDHYADRLTTTRIARMIGRSALVVRQEFKRAMGMSLRDYLTAVRIERAQHLLRASEKVEVVALQVGYRSKRQFIRQFKTHVGMIPSDFRRVPSAAHRHHSTERSIVRNDVRPRSAMAISSS